MIMAVIMGAILGCIAGRAFVRFLDGGLGMWIAFPILIVAILAGLMLIPGDESEFNNGYCIKCGAKYEAIDHRNNQTYYECPECHYGTWY